MRDDVYGGVKGQHQRRGLIRTEIEKKSSVYCSGEAQQLRKKQNIRGR